jgi:predicted dehydrogenase
MGSVQSLPRRQFLVRSAAALASPLVIRSSAWAAAGKPNDRITLGVIGVGWRGYYHVQHMVEVPEVQVLAVCDVVKSRREAAKACAEGRYAQRDGTKGSFRGVATYNDYRELLARDDIDAVMIATPEHWHAVQAIDAAKAGKDIYGEKPLSLSIREARAMVQAVRRYGRVFQTGSQQRSSWGCRFVCEAVRSGRLGTLQKVTLNVGWPSVDCYAKPAPVPEGTDWDMWLGPAPWHPHHAEPYGNYHFDTANGGVSNMGAHYFDIIQWALGADDSGPVEIHPPGGEYPWLTLKYANGVAVMNVVDRQSNFTDGVLFHGTAGRVEATHDGYANAWPKSLLRTPTGPDEVHLYNSPDPHPGQKVFGAQYGGYTMRHYVDWFRAIRTRQRPVADVEIGCRSVTVCHLVNIAYWLNRALRWDPVKELFVGDAEANRWLDRPVRRPWML